MFYSPWLSIIPHDTDSTYEGKKTLSEKDETDWITFNTTSEQTLTQGIVTIARGLNIKRKCKYCNKDVLTIGFLPLEREKGI